MPRSTVRIENHADLMNSDFDKEKDLSKYICSNIELFCRDVLSDTYVSHEEEVQVKKQVIFQPRQPRIDLKIICKNSTYLIELKNPKYQSENRAALGQLLCYSTILDESRESEMVLVSTKFDMLSAKTIQRFNLPIRYIYFEKSRFMEYLYDS